MEYDFLELLPDFEVCTNFPYRYCEDAECDAFEYPSINGNFVRFADYKMLMRAYLHKKYGCGISGVTGPSGRISFDSVARYNFAIEHHGNEEKCLSDCVAEAHYVSHKRMMQLRNEIRISGKDFHGLYDFSNYYVNYETWRALLELYSSLESPEERD